MGVGQRGASLQNCCLWDPEPPGGATYHAGESVEVWMGRVERARQPFDDGKAVSVRASCEARRTEHDILRLDIVFPLAPRFLAAQW